MDITVKFFKVFVHLPSGSLENIGLKSTKLLSHFTCSDRPWFSIFKSRSSTEQWVQESTTKMNMIFYKRLTNCKTSSTTHVNGAYIVSSLFANIISVKHHSNPKRLAGHPLLPLFYIWGNQSSGKLRDRVPVMQATSGRVSSLFIHLSFH